jgi:hypothetical protein
VYVEVDGRLRTSVNDWCQYSGPEAALNTSLERTKFLAPGTSKTPIFDTVATNRDIEVH